MRNVEIDDQDRKRSEHEKQRQRLLAEFGLPEDAKIIFLKKRAPSNHAPVELHFGTVVCFDQDTLELILVAKFHKDGSTPAPLRDQFNFAISTLYQHAKRRYPIKINGAVKKAESEFSGGKMYGVGFRPGYDPDFKAGEYFSSISDFPCLLTSISFLQLFIH